MMEVHVVTLQMQTSWTKTLSWLVIAFDDTNNIKTPDVVMFVTNKIQE